MLWKVWCLNLVWWQCQWHVWWQCQWHVCRHNCWHSAGRLVPVNRRHYYTRLCQVMSCPSWRTFVIKQISNSYEQRGSEDWVLPRSRFILDIHNKVTITDLIFWSHSQNLCSDPTLSMVTSLSVFLPYDVQEYDVQVRYPMTAPVGMYFLRQHNDQVLSRVTPTPRTGDDITIV